MAVPSRLEREIGDPNSPVLPITPWDCELYFQKIKVSVGTATHRL